MRYALLYFIGLPALLIVIALRAAWLRDFFAEALFGSAAIIMLAMIALTRLDPSQNKALPVLIGAMLFITILLLCDALVLQRNRKI